MSELAAQWADDMFAITTDIHNKQQKKQQNFYE